MPLTFPILAFFMTPGIFYMGAAATAIPIVIHLLNKRRFRVVVWAAMDFLLAAQRRNSRRMKLQRWLLLAVRCLALLVLAAAIAQFFLGSNVIGALGGGERAIVLIWDDAYPMAYRREPKASHFEAVRKLLKDYVAGTQSGDKIALISASNGGATLIEKPTLDHLAVRRAIENHQVTDGATDLPRAFDKAADALREVQQTAQYRAVVLLSDLSRSSLHTGSGSDEEAGAEAARQVLRKKIELLRSQAEFHVVDVGDTDQNNRAIVELAPVRAAIVAGMPTELKVSVMNATESALLDHPVTLSVDGVTMATEKLGRIGPGETRSTRLAITIPTPGRHLLEARLASDLLALDDVRRLAVNVLRELPLLLVDGNPGDNRTLGSTTFLQLAFAPTIDGKANSIFAPRVITELELPRTALGAALSSGADSGAKNPYAAVVLSDTGRLDAPTLKNLQRYVNEGGLLLVFPGGRTVASDMNQTLGDTGSNAVHLLPAAYGQLIRQDAPTGPAADSTASTEGAGGGLHFDPQNYGHPVLTPFSAAVQGGKNAGLSSTQVERYLRMVLPAQDAGVETILKLSDGNAAVITKKVGKGRVVQFAISSDTSWTSFPPRPSYVPFMWGLVFYGMARHEDNLTLDPGQSLHLPADAAPAGLWDGPRGTKVSVTTTVDDERRAWLTSPPLNLAGGYAPANRGGPAAGAVVVVNPDSQRAADIRHLKTADMANALGISTNGIAVQPRNLDTVAAPSAASGDQAGDLGRKLLLVALGLFVTEALLAAMFSKYR